MARMERRTPPEAQKLKQQIDALGKLKMSVGWFPSAVYPNGVPVAGVMAVHEFGASFMHPGGTKYKVLDDGLAAFLNSGATDFTGITKPHQITIPPRSFMRSTASEKSQSWSETAEMLGRRVLAGKMEPTQLAEALGMQAVGDIQKTISQITDPPLSSSTIAARRKRGNSNTKPLVDTRVAFNTLTFTVEGQ